MSTMGTKPPTHQVQELRRSSRHLVRALGVMRNRVEGVNCTPTQCHALIEFSDHGQLTTREISELIEIDKSTASRTLTSLLRAGLVEANTDPSDHRTKPLRLTGAGRERVLQIHVAANAQVEAALGLLTEEERAAVLRGVTLYERAFRRAKALAGVSIEPIQRQDDAAMARIIRSVMTEFDAVGPGYSILDDEVESMHRAYSRDRSVYFVAKRDGQPIAGAGFAPLESSDRPDMCELRKMFALPSARGLGIGRLLIDLCLSAARSAGFRSCYLETLRHMHQARALYEKMGFQAIDAPLGKTGHFACDDWYVLELNKS